MRRVVLPIVIILMLIASMCGVLADQQSIETLTLSQEEIVVSVGKTVTVKAVIEPKSAAKSKLEWTSSDETVATVKNGTIRGVSGGDATITVKATDGSDVSAVVKVTVVVPVKKISFKDKKITLAEDTTWRLSPEFLPADATDKGATWSSSNDKIASVDEKGIVTGHKVGKATILCKALDGSKKTATVTVNVKRFDIVIREPGEHSTGLNLANDYQIAEISFPGYYAKSVYERYVWYPNDVVAHAGGDRIRPVKAGTGSIECVGKDNGRVTEKWSRSVYVAQSAVE